jgi:hypothetical protein
MIDTNRHSDIGGEVEHACSQHGGRNTPSASIRLTTTRLFFSFLFQIVTSFSHVSVFFGPDTF